MAFCIQCGNPLSADARFCAHCGTRVEPITQPAPVQTTPIVQPVYSPVASRKPDSAPAEPVFTPEVPVEPVYSAPVEPVFAPEVPAEPVFTPEVPAESAYCAPVVQSEPVYAPPVQEEPVQEAPQEEPVWQPAPEETIYEGPVYADPVEPQYVPPVKVERKPLISKKPLSIGKKILVIFLSILAFIFGTATVMALCLRATLTADNVAQFISDLDISKVKASTFILDAEENDSVSEWLIVQLEKKGVDCSVLTNDDVDEFLEACIIPFVEDEVQEFASALLTGKGKASVTMDEIRELVNDSRNYLFKEYGVIITDESADMLVTWIDGFGVTEMANTKYLEKEYGDALDTARMVLSWAAVAVFGFLTFLMLLFIWLTNKSLIRNLNSTGTIAALVGGMFTVFTVIKLVFPSLLLTICGNIDLLHAAVSMVITSGTTVILATFGAGVALLLLSRLLQIKVRK